MKLSDVIHFYLGQKCLINNGTLENKIDTITHININGDVCGNEYEWQVNECQIILCRVDDMTEEEVKGLIGWEKTSLLYKDLKYKKHPTGINIEYTIDAEGDYLQFHYIDFLRPSPTEFYYLLSHGFDLFNLIPEGQAIDAKTIK